MYVCVYVFICIYNQQSVSIVAFDVGVLVIFFFKSVYKRQPWHVSYCRLDCPQMQCSTNAPFPSISCVTPCGPSATVVDTSGPEVSRNFSVA